MQHCEYGFTVNVPLEVALSDVFLMATHYDGTPSIPITVIRCAAWPARWPGSTRKTIATSGRGQVAARTGVHGSRSSGFWEQAGYSMTANVWKEERFGW